MGTKRSADQTGGDAPHPRRESSKRARLSPPADVRSNSSLPSSCSVSEDSALQSSPPLSAHGRVSSVSSLPSSDTDDDSESSGTSDSDSDLSDSDEEGDIATLGGPKKPQIHHEAVRRGGDDLKARVAALLPRLEAANSLLMSQGGHYSMEAVEDGEQHIEMNLGLGVLEQQNEDENSESERDSASDSDSCGVETRHDARYDEDELPILSGEVEKSLRGRETRAMEELTGRRQAAKHATIEEIG